jgi:hypothetical protein
MRSTLGRNRHVEHSTQRHTLDITCMHTETYHAPSELIHDQEHPVALQVNGFTPEQVNAPEAVFRVSQEAQP